MLKQKFEDWYSSHLTIGPYPNVVVKNFNYEFYDVIINMSDEWYPDIDEVFKKNGLSLFRSPMNESKRDVGLNSIYGAMNILWDCEKNNKRVYLHCHQGKNRSRATAAAYFFMRTGVQEETIENSGFINKLVAMCGRGYLPPKAEMEKFLRLLWKNFMDIGDHRLNGFDHVNGGCLDDIKTSAINNF